MSPLLLLLVSLTSVHVLPDNPDQLRILAEAGDPEAQNLLGFKYFNGEGIAERKDSAIFWLTKAAEAGNPKAAANLGFIYLHGPGITHNPQKAFRWLERGSDAGLPQAQAMLADMLAKGDAVEPDTLRAEALYEKAAASGLPDAGLKLLNMMGRKWERLPEDSLIRLAERHYYGNLPGLAVHLLRTATEKGNSKAMYLLGEAYSIGRGVAYDHTKSMSMFLRAALEGEQRARRVIAESIAFFPDLLLATPFKEIIERKFPSGKIPEGIYDASYWEVFLEDSGQ